MHAFPHNRKGDQAALPAVDFIDPPSCRRRCSKTICYENGLLNDAPQARTDIYTTAETYEFAAAIKRLRLEFDTLGKVKLFEETDGNHLRTPGHGQDLPGI
jgi:hypothetical protein